MNLFTVAMILAVDACDSVPGASSADLGVRAGGQQDIAAARAIIEDGGSDRS
ncbi:MAG: hypothetical protein IH987_15940 [Planctomycetes bacterium]|nr:hypothetical protein [Planctomycetota bacterium]